MTHVLLCVLDMVDSSIELLIRQQEGLEEVKDKSVYEQLKFLLAERSRLLEEVNNGLTSGFYHTPEGNYTASELWDMLQQER